MSKPTLNDMAQDALIESLEEMGRLIANSISKDIIRQVLLDMERDDWNDSPMKRFTSECASRLGVDLYEEQTKEQGT